MISIESKLIKISETATVFPKQTRPFSSQNAITIEMCFRFRTTSVEGVSIMTVFNKNYIFGCVASTLDAHDALHVNMTYKTEVSYFPWSFSIAATLHLSIPHSDGAAF